MFLSQKQYRKQLLSQLKAFKSYYNKRAEKIWCKQQKVINKCLEKIEKVCNED